jgi:hypothetical protein
MPSGLERTRKLEEITAALRLRSTAVRSLLHEYQNSTSPGLRLIAICILQQFPNAAELEWLVDRLDMTKEPPFCWLRSCCSAYSSGAQPAFDRQQCSKKFESSPPPCSIFCGALPV